jgi:hypothetical protein
MERTIKIAKSVLSSMFGISEIHFEKHISRRADVNEARRFLVYYLVRECGIKYAYVKNHVPSLTNHATAIHHVRRMNDMMDVEPHTKELYQKFRVTMETEGQTHLVKDYQKALIELDTIKDRLKTLKRMV